MRRWRWGALRKSRVWGFEAMWPFSTSELTAVMVMVVNTEAHHGWFFTGSNKNHEIYQIMGYQEIWNPVFSFRKVGAASSCVHLLCNLLRSSCILLLSVLIRHKKKLSRFTSTHCNALKRNVSNMYEYVCSPLCNENKVCFYNTQIAYYFIQKNNELRSPQDSVNKIMILLNPRLTANPTPEFLSKANVRILTKISSVRTKGGVQIIKMEI